MDEKICGMTKESLRQCLSECGCCCKTADSVIEKIESRDMVVRALGNLNAQGRKVGIISHTEQIRDNIFPQVQVVRSKASDSTSTIRIAYN